MCVCVCIDWSAANTIRIVSADGCNAMRRSIQKRKRNYRLLCVPCVSVLIDHLRCHFIIFTLDHLTASDSKDADRPCNQLSVCVCVWRHITRQSTESIDSIIAIFLVRERTKKKSDARWVMSHHVDIALRSHRRIVKCSAHTHTKIIHLSAIFAQITAFICANTSISAHIRAKFHNFLARRMWLGIVFTFAPNSHVIIQINFNKICVNNKICIKHTFVCP